MALSNWDTLAFGPDGKICDGEFHSEKNKDFIEIYKNWVHLGSPNGWVKGGHFIKPVVGSLNSGDLSFGPFSINAIRHEEQNSIFIYATESFKVGEDYVDRHFAGIGCYGFGNEALIYLRKLGRDTSDVDDWNVGSTFNGNGELEETALTNLETHENIIIDPKDVSEDRWVGVTEVTHAAFFEWLDKISDKHKNYSMKSMCDWVDLCRKEVPKSFNQGDAYFAEKLGFEVPVSVVGEPVKPILLTVLENK